jgi:hypothetical protein
MLVFSLQALPQALTQEFINAGYTLTDLGSINLLPPQYGGLTIRTDQPNTLYIGGDANAAGGGIYTVPLLRDPVSHHITGFGGDATLYAPGPNNDGGIFFAPNGTLLYTKYSMNELGQILPNNTTVVTPLTQYGIASSVGSIALVPSNYPGAGNMIIASYNADIVYHIPFTVAGTGEYLLSSKLAEVSISGTANGPEGIAFIPQGSAGFPNPSMVISSYGYGKVVVFEVGTDGLPKPATARDMVTGLTGAEGAWIDPVTGDFLFSTFGGGNKIIRISGFEAPSAIGDKEINARDVFRIFPNPSSGPVSIEFHQPGMEGNFEIYNIAGKMVTGGYFNSGRVAEIDLTGQPDGIYFFRAQYNGKIVSQRFVLQK